MELAAARDAAAAKRNESRPRSSARSPRQGGGGEASESLCLPENAAHRKNLDERARGERRRRAQETRDAREELAAASRARRRARRREGELARALEDAEARADAADTCAAPLRAETAAALARCKRGEDAARAMADRLAVARVAHAQAMSALNEVGARLVGESAIRARRRRRTRRGRTRRGGRTRDRRDVRSRATRRRRRTRRARRPSRFPETSVGLRPGSGSPAAPVGMDIMYETEPPSEMPAHGGAKL